MIYANPGSTDSLITFKNTYGNYVGGEWKAPIKGLYFDILQAVFALMKDQWLK